MLYDSYADVEVSPTHGVVDSVDYPNDYTLDGVAGYCGSKPNALVRDVPFSDCHGLILIVPFCRFHAMPVSRLSRIT